jgi:hypothetical protein
MDIEDTEENPFLLSQWDSNEQRVILVRVNPDEYDLELRQGELVRLRLILHPSSAHHEEFLMDQTTPRRLWVAHPLGDTAHTRMITPPERIHQDPEVTPFIRDWARYVSYCTFPCTWPEVSLILRNTMHPYGRPPIMPTVLNSFEPVGRIFVLQMVRFEHPLHTGWGPDVRDCPNCGPGYIQPRSESLRALYPQDFPIGATLQDSGGNPVGYEYIDDTLVQSGPREDSDEPPSLEEDEPAGFDQLAIYDSEDEVAIEDTEFMPQ